MAKRVPSFKMGGTYWFLDLTTPDSLLVLPALTTLGFWIYITFAQYLNNIGTYLNNICTILLDTASSVTDLFQNQKRNLLTGLLLWYSFYALRSSPRLVKSSFLYSDVGTYKICRSSDEYDLVLFDISDWPLDIHKILFVNSRLFIVKRSNVHDRVYTVII